MALAYISRRVWKVSERKIVAVSAIGI